MRLAAQVQARTQQRTATTGQLRIVVLEVAHGRNLAGVRAAKQDARQVLNGRRGGSRNQR